MNATHQDDDNNIDLNEMHKDVVIIKSETFDNNDRYSESFESKVYNTYGDADVKAGGRKKIDLVLKFYSGVPLMIDNNEFINEERGNGTKCAGLSV